MRKRIVAAVTILLAMYFDSILFARLNIYGVCPDVMLAAAVSFGVLTGSLSGGVFGLIGGLLMDILFGRMVGLHAAVYLTAGACAGLFFQKFYADNVIVPTVTAVAAGFVKDLIFAAVVALSGARMGFGLVLLQYILPSAAMTGAAAMGIYLICKPLLLRQVSRTLNHR